MQSKDRGKKLRLCHQQTFDVLVIGGGITGCGIALDTITRGMKTVLLEMQDFAAGTSSRSTKLVHGGLRYLKQWEVKMVAEVGKERAIVYENGPHVTTPEWMLLPIYEGGTLGRFRTSLGLRLYDFLAGVKRSERRQMLSAKEVLGKEPLLKKQGLKGGGYYVEYRTDDARLTIEVLKEAVKHGAQAFNYAKVEDFLYGSGKVIGVKAVDQLSGEVIEILARKIINATGPWVDFLREKDQSKMGKTLQLTKGVHLVFDQRRFPLKQSIYFDTSDKRMVFAIPRDGKTYVGTTDTVYEENLEYPRMSEQDQVYLLRCINDMFPTLQLTEKDVESSWAGLRPLIHEEGKGPSQISRRDEIWQSSTGLITIAGGKLTGYRKMAELVVDLVAKSLRGDGGFGPCQTKHLPISGGEVGGSGQFLSFLEERAKKGVKLGLTVHQAEKLTRLYGSNVDRVFDYANTRLESTLPLDLKLMLVYALEEEMVVKPTDFFIRRTGAVFFRIEWVHRWKDAVLEHMAKYFSWTQSQRKNYAKELEDALTHAVEAVK